MSPPLLVENNYDVSADVISDLIDWLLPLLFLPISQTLPISFQNRHHFVREKKLAKHLTLNTSRIGVLLQICLCCQGYCHLQTCFLYPVGIQLLKVNNRNTRTNSEICSVLTIKTPGQHQWRHSTVFIVNFEHILNLVLVFYC